MASNTKPKAPQTVEIVVSTYWPTKIIKSINIKESGKETYRNSITLTASDAEYVYQQLAVLYGEASDE